MEFRTRDPKGLLIGIEIIEGGAPIEVCLQVIGNIIVEGIGIIGEGAGRGVEAEVYVPVIAENEEEANMMMMRGIDEVDLMEEVFVLPEGVPILGGFYLVVKHLLLGLQVILK